MAHTAMLDTHPRGTGELDRDALTACIEACFDCAQTCTACADACLAEDTVSELTRCIRTNLDCADICATTGRATSRLTDADTVVLRVLVEACASVCRVCGDECSDHADMHEHCRVCAEACRRCEQACRDLLPSIG